LRLWRETVVKGKGKGGRKLLYIGGYTRGIAFCGVGIESW